MSLLGDYAAAVWSHSPRTLGTSTDGVERSELLEAWAAAIWAHSPRTLTVPATGPATIREAVYSRICGTAAVADVAGDRIRPGGLPQLDSLPAITYDLSRSFGHNLSGSDGTASSRVEISCWSRKYLEAAALAEGVRLRFDGFSGWIGRVEVLCCLADDELELHEEPDPKSGRPWWLYRVLLPLVISHRIPKPDQLGE